MTVSLCTISDFSRIREDIVRFWGSDRTLYLHHPMLVYEFGNTAFVIRDQDVIAAYLFGFFSQTENVAYAHLVAVRDTHKRMGLGKKLYDHFINIAKARGIGQLKAITTADNTVSVAFHTQQIGMQLKGELHAGCVPVVKDYSGPGLDRVVFVKNIR
eukprot:Unigene4562_Nuclearia_a/m.13928 Unigene4562_Nuclearia_a/g.13928  ORF Unigene4562_Nuclearia_a/g.13928 Unigene4562_Nuclearia_a/m.13928 type:complete len:157 (-) Unigene4562_Nuclearia_a:191-661(-)